jgi:hypothetical protein
MSIAAFLDGKPERVFFARFPPKYVTGAVARVWSLDTPYRAHLSGADDLIATYLIADICQEHAKRVIVDLCRSVVKLHVARLDKLVEGSAADMLAKLAESGDVVYERTKDYVTLGQPSIGRRVAAEVKAFQDAQQ